MFAVILLKKKKRKEKKKSWGTPEPHKHAVNSNALNSEHHWMNFGLLLHLDEKSRRNVDKQPAICRLLLLETNIL